MNQDGQASIADVTALVNHILGKDSGSAAPDALTIHFADGTTRDIPLNAQPHVTFEGDDVVITTLDASYSYDAQDVLRFTYAGKPLDNPASSGAGSIGEAFYIYRNDGEFNAFFRDEVDSIAYSDYDIDSIRHTNFVVQDVFTEDSIYRIPLAAIDSVGFVTRTLPISFYEENFAGWSDVLFCNNGMIAFHIDRTENEPEKSLILLPDEEYGIIWSFTIYDAESHPRVITFNDDVVYISESEDGSSICTVVQGDSLVYQRKGVFYHDSNEIKSAIIRRSIRENNWQRNVIAAGKVITGSFEIAGGSVI